MNRTFQRTNWSNDQVINFLRGQKLNETYNKHCPNAGAINEAIDDLIDFFYDFKRPETEFGAMSYCVEEDMVYHIGGLPEPLRVQVEEEKP